MKPLPLLLSASALSAAVSLTTVLLASPAANAAPEGGAVSAVSPELTEMSARLDELLGEQRSLRDELSAMRDRAPLATRDAGREEVGALDAAVQRWMDENGERLAALVGAVDGDGVRVIPPAPPERIDFETAVAELSDPNAMFDERQELWEKIRAAGQLDEFVAWFEERATNRPDDPEAQVALAQAYLQKVFEVGNSPAAGIWANKADKAYDQALASDPQHWEARFSKAVSLSHWPKVMGKQAEAINHFQVLVEQQELGGQLEPEYAQTYFLLGNLYQEQGDKEKALAIWEQGLGYFPNDESLSGQIAQLSGE